MFTLKISSKFENSSSFYGYLKKYYFTWKGGYSLKESFDYDLNVAKTTLPLFENDSNFQYHNILQNL